MIVIYTIIIFFILTKKKVNNEVIKIFFDCKYYI